MRCYNCGLDDPLPAVRVSAGQARLYGDTIHLRRCTSCEFYQNHVGDDETDWRGYELEEKEHA